MKPTFLNQQKPLLTAMVQEKTPEGAICVIMNSLYDGAEAFGIQLCNLLPEYRNVETLRKIFSYCEGRPIYITSYRGAASKGLSDDERVELLLMGLEAGATLCDVIGDLYAPTTDQLTFDVQAVEKQKALIRTIHERGGEVLISTHTSRYFTEDEVLAYAKEQIARGADVVKIVAKANSEDEQMDALHTIHRLHKELEKPFLFLVGGTHTRLVRQIGPALGVCMYLCVESYLPVTTKAQPRLRNTKLIRDNMLL
ncbi:MAG: type I 3-dehydroquinate dehydratase [Ruminococcaceae bacterium]|nr:type I 3-dehydroquinate dehydratase [Oscillospiraceae bacterium]